MKVEHNIERIKHLLKLYQISESEFYALISDGLKTPLTETDVFGEEIKLSHLKRIDKIFNKGIAYYLDPSHPIESIEASVFFRKSTFNADLNIGAKKIVTHFEDLKVSLSVMSKLSDLNLNRKIPVFQVSDDPKSVAVEVRQKLYPFFVSDKKKFLEALIGKFSDENILVFEFVETWNKKDKANIDGFFLQPNVIVLKRHQKALRREIFTLAHELGHYLLNEEEVENIEDTYVAKSNLNTVERWCNDFAYYFLVGDFADVIHEMESANAQNDYHHELIERISDETHISTLALFTRLLFDKKISQVDYNNVKNDLKERFENWQEQERQKREKEKEMGIPQRGSVPQPIKAPLLISTLQNAFFSGIIDENQLCQTLNIKPKQIDKYIL